MEKITLNDIKRHMLSYMSHNGTDTEYYDEDGHCGGGLWEEIKEFWSNFNTVKDFEYLVSCRWCGDIDLDGGRDYILSLSKVTPLLFSYMYNTLGWTKTKYESVIHNTTDLSDEILDMFDDISVIRDSKIDSIIESEKNTSNVENGVKVSKRLVLKYPKALKDLVDKDGRYKFIGLSKIDKNPIYSMDIIDGFEIIKELKEILK